MKAILLNSKDIWNNDRSDNFEKVQVIDQGAVTEEQRETYYPCSLYFEVGATDSMGFECLAIESRAMNYDGKDFKIFIVTVQTPDGRTIPLQYPDPRTIDCRAYDWARTGFGGATGMAAVFTVDDVQTYTTPNRKKVEEFLNAQIAEMRGDDEGDDDAGAEMMASEYSVERINPTVVNGKEDVHAESFGAEFGADFCASCSTHAAECMCAEFMPSGDGQVVGQATANTNFTPFAAEAAFGGLSTKMAECGCFSAECMCAEVMPAGSGNVIGQSTTDTDFTPFGFSAEDGEIVQDCLVCGEPQDMTYGAVYAYDDGMDQPICNKPACVSKWKQVEAAYDKGDDEGYEVYEKLFGAEGLYKCSGCGHWNRNPIMEGESDDGFVTKCKKCGSEDFTKAAEGDFGAVGDGNNFGQYRSESYKPGIGTYYCQACDIRGCDGCFADGSRCHQCGDEDIEHLGIDAHPTHYCQDCNARFCAGCIGEDDPACDVCNRIFEHTSGPFDEDGNYIGNRIYSYQPRLKGVGPNAHYDNFGKGAEFLPDGEGRILGVRNSTTDYTPLGYNAEGVGGRYGGAVGIGLAVVAGLLFRRWSNGQMLNGDDAPDSETPTEDEDDAPDA